MENIKNLKLVKVAQEAREAFQASSDAWNAALASWATLTKSKLNIFNSLSLFILLLLYTIKNIQVHM